MWDNMWFKVLKCIVSVAGLLFVGFMGMIMAALGDSGKFYTPVVMISTGALIVFVIFWIFKIVKLKVLTIMLIVFLGIFTLVITGYEIHKSYYKSLPTVDEQGVNLQNYKPFKENTKAVKLKEPSKMKIETELPKLDGATALYPLYSSFVQATYPQKEYDTYKSEVMCNNTIGAYKRLINGEVDIIFTARPSKQQVDEAKAKGIEFSLTPIGYEAFVFFVNVKNNINGLTTSQIQDIYSGKITNWKEVGGRNDKIRAFQRLENSGSQTMLQKFMEDKNLMVPPKEDVAKGMGDIINQTASYRNYKNAIGYSFLFFATEMVQNNQIKLLRVNDIYPDKNAVRNKVYPLATEFYAVTADGKNPNIERFIGWILSQQGQSLVEKTGYISLLEKTEE